MRLKGVLILTALLLVLQGYGQYLENPSFEGISAPHVPPPNWTTCNFSVSTPDTQPGQHGVILAPSDGETYVGMTARDNNTWEDIQAQFVTPLSVDSCYIFQIDLAHQESVGFYSMEPISVLIYGSDESCDDSNILWESPSIGSEDWVTHEFLIQPDEFDIEYLNIVAYYSELPEYWGYVLMDNIVITPTPFIDLGNDTTITICDSSVYELSPGVGYDSYLWQDGSTDSVYLVDTTGYYWVEISNSNGCSAAAEVYIEVVEFEDLQAIMADSLVVCEGEAVEISVVAYYGAQPYTYEWVGLPDTTANIFFIPELSTTLYVNVSDSCGNVISDSIIIDVIPVPDVFLGNDTLVCEGFDIDLDAGSGYSSYLWQDGSGNSTFQVDQTGTFWVEVENEYGCTTIDSIVIDILPPMPIHVGNDTTLCQGDSITFNAGSGFIEYLWQDGSTDTSLTVTQSGIYWVLVKDTTGCLNTDTIIVDYDTYPDISLGNDTILCDGHVYSISPGSGFATYLWQDGSTGDAYNVSMPGTYWVKVSNACGVDSDSVYIDFYPETNVNLGEDTVICSTETLLLEVSGQFISYSWQDGSQDPFYMVSSTGSYSVEVVDINGCSAEDEVFVFVSDPQTYLGPDSVICEGDVITLDAGDGFAGYLWQNGSEGQFFELISGGDYWVEVTDEYGCSGSDSVHFSLQIIPLADLGDDQNICEGDTIILEAKPGEFEYFWNGIIGDQSLTVQQGGTYELKVVNECGMAIDEVIIFEHPLPDVDLGEDKVIQQDEVIQLDAGGGFIKYIWHDGSNGQYFQVDENNIDQQDPLYYVEVFNDFCKNSDTIRIEFFKVEVPTVMTPNGDGFNDLFIPKPDGWSAINEHLIVIYNRWGGKVWESNDFLSGWDGKQNGRQVAEGTYYWVLEVYYGTRDLKQTIKGSLTVLGVND